MSEGKGTALGLIAVILAASGLGLTGYNMYLTQGVKGADGKNGSDGEDGIDGDNGTDAPGSITVGILDPDMGEVVSGNVSIRALVFGSEEYTTSVMRNGTEIGTLIPMEWNSTTVADDWYNITVRVVDKASGSTSQDMVIVYVRNTVENKSMVRGTTNGKTISQSTYTKADWDGETYDTNNDFSLVDDNFTVPWDGYFEICAAFTFGMIVAGDYCGIFFKLNGAYYTTGAYTYSAGVNMVIVLTDTILAAEGDGIDIGIYTTSTGGASYAGYFTINEV